MENLLTKLEHDFKDIKFSHGKTFHWSPYSKTVVYQNISDKKNTDWTLLHEVGHAKLNHINYNSDVELLYMEVAAWQKASEIAKKYGITINNDHIQNCLDSYRNWLHQRSACPVCSNHSLQKDNTHYYCFNCHAVWLVSIARFCRPYRKIDKQKETLPSTVS
jgi:hypothetical protein